MKKANKKLLTLALVALFASAGAGGIATAAYSHSDVTVAMAAIADMTKVDGAIDCAMPLEEGKVKNITEWGYYDSNADGAADVWAFKGDGTATKQPEIRFSTPGTDTTPSSASRVYKPITATKISVDYNITNSGTALAESSTTKYLLQILGATEGTGSPNQYYYHVPEIIDDGQWHTLTIDLNSAFTGGTDENLPMNISKFDDINDLVCCWNFKMGADFNGEAMFKNFTVENEVQMVDYTATAKMGDVGSTGDYADAPLFRIWMNQGNSSSTWGRDMCLNESTYAELFDHITLNGKSLTQYRAEYKALIESGAQSPITWETKMQGNIVSDVENGRATYAPIFVNATSHGNLGDAIDIYIPNTFLPRNEIGQLCIKAGFELNGHGFAQDVTFSFSGCMGRADQVVKEVGEVAPYKATATEVYKTGFKDGFFLMYLSENDYAGTSHSNGAALLSTLATLKFYDNILFDGKPMRSYMQNALNEPYFQVWGYDDVFAIRPPVGSAQEIKFLAGCQFPSFAYDKQGGEKMCYELQEDVTFVLQADGSYVNTELLLKANEITISDAKIAGEKGELYQIDITCAKWEFARDGYDYNYFGAEFQNMRKNILINGVSLWEINTTVDDSAYAYSTGPFTNDALEPGNSGYQLFQNPTVLYGKAGGNTLTVWVHKQYIEDTKANEIEIQVTKGYVHNGGNTFVLETAVANVWKRPMNVTINGEAQQGLVYGDKVAKPADPAAYDENGYHYTFDNWYVAGTDTVYDFDATLTSDVAIEARFVSEAIEYTVAFTHPKTGMTLAAPITYTVENMASVVFPEVPAELAMEGYTVAWNKTAADLAIGGLDVNPVWTAIEYTLTFTHPRTGMHVAAPITYTVENMGEIVFPEVPAELAMEGYTVAWNKTAADVTLGGCDVNPVWTVIEYTLTFTHPKTGMVLAAPITYTVENMGEVVFPEVPADLAMEGYTVAWNKTAADLAIGGLDVNPVWTAIEYTLTFTHPRTGMHVAAPITYTVENMSEVVFPEVPAELAMEGYTVAWNKTAADLAIGGLDVNPVWTVIEYTITFVSRTGMPLDGYDTITFTVDTIGDVVFPEVPAQDAGWEAVWDKSAADLTLEDTNVTLIVFMTEYTVTFMADGAVVGTATYYVEDKDNIVVPAVPVKEGYTGEWEAYELTIGDITVNAIYTEIPVEPGESEEPDVPVVPGESEEPDVPVVPGESEEPTSEPEESKKKGGCGSSVALGMVGALTAAGAALVIKKRKED